MMKMIVAKLAVTAVVVEVHREEAGEVYQAVVEVIQEEVLHQAVVAGAILHLAAGEILRTAVAEAAQVAAASAEEALELCPVKK